MVSDGRLDGHSQGFISDEAYDEGVRRKGQSEGAETDMPSGNTGSRRHREEKTSSLG
jgi:hypothetical protein